MNRFSTIPDVNYHVINKCNMDCRFCFAQFKDARMLGKEESLSVVRKIGEYGFRKINFVGGEPTLVPWLKDLLKEAKECGLVTSVISNGWNVDRLWLEEHTEHLDWIGLSVDSLRGETNQALGRIVAGKKTPGLLDYMASLREIRRYGVKLKINTVVTQVNKDESFHEIIREFKPEKWKIFQVLIIDNENQHAKELSITDEAFEGFLRRHSDLSSVTPIFPEYCDDMVSSYLIVDPAGRFVDNSTGCYRFSDCILDVSVKASLDQVEVSLEKFFLRQSSGRLNDIVTDVNRGKGGEI